MEPFIDALHVAFGAGVVASLIGAGISMMRGGNRSWEETPVTEELVSEGLITDAEAGASI